MTGEDGNLYSLGIHPSARGKGIAFKLLEALEAWFERWGAAFPAMAKARQAKTIELSRRGGTRIVLPLTDEPI